MVYERKTRSDAKGIMPRIGRAILWIAGLGVILTAAMAGFDRYASAAVLRKYPPPGEFVTVNGAKMHYVCQGSGQPTLVLEAGIGGGALDWSPILPQLSEQHRVCAFDRFGQDYSDKASSPRHFGTAADELHIALSQLGIQNPVVVGHSLGGAVVQVYAAKYDVSGVILVDGLTTADVDAVVERLGSYQSLDWLGRIGLLRPMGSLLVDRSYQSPVREQMKALRSNSAALLALTEEGAAAAATAGAELRDAEAKILAPMLLIGAENSDVPGLPPGKFSASLEALALRKPGAIFVQIADGRHYVHADHPAEVAAAIRTWLTQR